MPERERGAVRPSSSFHERECCVFEVCCYCERGVGRGSPRPRRLRRSRCRITLASKARLPDPPLLTRLHPPRTQASCSCGPRLQKRCWVRCGEPWRSPPRISPTTSDIVPGAVVRHPDDHPFAREGGLEDAPPHQRCLPVPERTPRDMPARLPAASHSGSPAPSTLKGLGCAAKRRVPQSFRPPMPSPSMPRPCGESPAAAMRLPAVPNQPPCLPLPPSTVPPACSALHCLPACLPACRLARWITGALNAQRIAGVPTMSRAERRAAACPGLSTCLPPAFAAPAVPNRPPCLPVAAVRRAARLSSCPPPRRRITRAFATRRIAGVPTMPDATYRPPRAAERLRGPPDPACLPPTSAEPAVSHRLLRPSVCRRLPCRRLRRLPATPHGGPPAPSTLGESLASLPCPSRGGSPRTFACLPTCAEACPHRDRAANRQRPSCHPAAVPPPANLCHVVPPSSAMRRRSPPPVAPATPAEPRHKRADPKATRRNGQPSQPSTPPPSSPPPLRLPAILPLASLPATSSPACLPALSAAPTSDAAAPPSSTSPPCLPTDPAARAACQPCRCSCWPIPALSAPSLQACLLIRGDAPLPVRPCSAPPRGASDLPKKTKARRTSSRALVSYRRDARA